MSDLRRAFIVGASLALLATAAAAAQVAPAVTAPPPAPAPTGLRFDCTDEEFVFAEVCTGRLVGVVGLALFDHRGVAWDRGDDPLLERHGIRNVTDPRANYAPRADWRGFACETVSGNLLELKGVIPEFLYTIPMNKCRGATFADGNFAVRELVLYVTPAGARVGEIEGVFRGHPDNTVFEGSFRDALVKRFGAKNCDTGLASSYCRQGARTRITVQQMEPEADGSRFWVRIKTPEVRDSAVERANQAIEEARKKAPVNDF